MNETSNTAVEAVTAATVFDWTSFWIGLVSLIVGFTSLIVAGFAIWLSWQFYKAAQTQGDRTTDAVGRIESTVNNIHSSINQVVERAVSAWVKSTGASAEEGIAAGLAESYNELREKLDALEKRGKSEPLPPDVLGLILQGQARTEALLSSMRETRIRSLFPVTGSPATEPAVTAAKTAKAVGTGAEHGEVRLSVHREATVITGTIQLDCDVLAEPNAEVTLVSAPSGVSGIRVSHGFGQGSQLNIHLRNEPGTRVKIGDYVLSYEVRTAPRAEPSK
jgi:cytoskeletal protein RodZ